MEVWLWVPLPLVVKLLQLAKAWHGQELPWFTDEKRPGEHPMRWTFASNQDGNRFYEASIAEIRVEKKKVTQR